MSPDLEINQEKGLEIPRLDNFRYRTHYFTDSGVIGSKKFVKEHYQLEKNKGTLRQFVLAASVAIHSSFF
jgi:hypothetical protein